MRTIQQPKAKPDGRWRSSFLDNLRRDDLSPVTVRGYGYDLDQFLAWFAEAKGGPLRFEAEAGNEDLMTAITTLEARKNRVLGNACTG